MRTPLAFIFVALAAGSSLPARAQGTKPDSVIDWEDAKNYVGKTVTLEGRVVSTRRTDIGIVLDFHADFASHFRVIIPGGAVNKFPSDPMVRFAKRNVQVTGKVETQSGVPFMRVSDPKNIKTLPVKRKPAT